MIAGDDAARNKELMDSLKTEGRYSITPQMREKLGDFYGNYASEKETADVIKAIYEDTGYVIDTQHQQQVRLSLREVLWMQSTRLNTIQ